MGDLLDEILAEIADEKKNISNEERNRRRRKDRGRFARQKEAKLEVFDKVEALLNRGAPKNHIGACRYCDNTDNRHYDDCPWLELKLEYTKYYNKYIHREDQK